jgi:hypothetical protein
MKIRSALAGNRGAGFHSEVKLSPWPQRGQLKKAASHLLRLGDDDDPLLHDGHRDRPYAATSNEGSATTDGNALPNRDPPHVTRFKAAAAKRVQAHRLRARLGLRCLTVRVSDRTARHLISTGYLALESSKSAPMVAIALEAWIYDNVT